MVSPRLSDAELWEGIRSLWQKGETIYSLAQRKEHTIVDVDEAAKKYTIEYASGNRLPITLGELSALYRELYRSGELRGSYMNDPKNCRRILGWSSWNAPGSAMFALLPVLDKRIRVERAELFIDGKE